MHAKLFEWYSYWAQFLPVNGSHGIKSIKLTLMLCTIVEVKIMAFVHDWIALEGSNWILRGSREK